MRGDPCYRHEAANEAVFADALPRLLVSLAKGAACFHEHALYHGGEGTPSLDQLLMRGQVFFIPESANDHRMLWMRQARPNRLELIYDVPMDDVLQFGSILGASK